MKITYLFDSDNEGDMEEHKTFSNARKYMLALLKLDLEIQRLKHAPDIYYQDLRNMFFGVLEECGLDLDIDF